MALENLKIQARNGSALVEGRLLLGSRETAVAPLLIAAPNDLFGLALTHDGSHRSTVSLYRKSQRAADGLYAVAPPILNMSFGDLMPDLQCFAFNLHAETTERLLLRADGPRLLTINFKPDGRADAPLVFARLEEVALEIERRKVGLIIRIKGLLLPFALEKDGPFLHDVWLDCNFLLPAAYGPLSSFDSHIGGWEPRTLWRSGQATPLARSALGPGLVDWQQDRDGRHCNGPFAQVHLAEDDMIIRPSRHIWTHANGMGSAELDHDGPQVRLGFGRRLLASLLAHDDRAEVSFRTAIGQVDGLTGRSAYDAGPMTQTIRQLNLKLDRQPHELRVEGEGELEPAMTGDSLGPRLRFHFTLPRTWLLARGIHLPRFYDDWKKELKGVGVTDVW